MASEKEEDEMKFQSPDVRAIHKRVTEPVVGWLTEGGIPHILAETAEDGVTSANVFFDLADGEKRHLESFSAVIHTGYAAEFNDEEDEECVEGVFGGIIVVDGEVQFFDSRSGEAWKYMRPVSSSTSLDRVLVRAQMYVEGLETELAEAKSVLESLLEQVEESR